jgi:chorismate dehydratase
VVKALRLGVVPYLNVSPIIHGLLRDPRFEIVPELPSRLADRLHAGDVDLGMIPSIEYAKGDYRIVPGIAIGSRGEVGSVCLFHRIPLPDVRRVALDASSRTSVALARILLSEVLGREPEYVTLPPPIDAMLGAADAALAIGDPALYFQGEAQRVDLGELWQRATGLPFVFAFWAGRPGAVGRVEVAALQASLVEGLRSIPAIASSYNGFGRGRAAENEAYLRSRIVFDLGESQERGLAEFYRRAEALGLIPAVPEIRFYEHR